VSASGSAQRDDLKRSRRPAYASAVTGADSSPPRTPIGCRAMIARLRRRPRLTAVAIYLAIGFLYFGLRLLIEPGAQYVGPFEDPLVAMWDLAWTPHALLHGENPFVTHELWAPTGVNLTWATSIPLLGVLF